ncbi:ATP-dependent endonuclease [Capnocytophaga leadbetteri]|jgi:ATP-dependent endonuclease of the OLD family|uniref:ATP-dependent nuclease n=1 Tax=Capnocytophaga leadbetteri TaxID=327575 RepID=UPI0026EBE371|nr:AAA family ATPase [Capnocytophaga leadbetteri]
MYLSNIKLWNFRKYGNDTFDIDNPNLDLNFTEGLNVLIGENDSGKTAIIDAIKIVLKTHSYEYIKIEADDFYNNSDRLRIELKFKGLLDEEAKNFTEWLTWEGQGENSTSILRVFYDVRRKDYKILPSEVKAGADTEGYSLTAEAREYLKATYLRPLRDAENELISKRNSRLSQILLGDDIFKEKDIPHPLVEEFKNINSSIEDYFKEGAEGADIKKKIDSYIKGFYGEEKESLFEASKNDIKSILEKLSLSLNGQKNVGLGTLNRLFMAAELLHLNKKNWEGLRLGLIEELEAHLHPQAQMQVIETLQKQEEVQLIITTHSPNLASKIKLKNLIICNGDNAFPMGDEYTKLEKSSYVFLEKFLDVTKSNLFFAKGVILVEGWAEEILIPSLAKAIGFDLTAKGVSVVNVGNLGFDHYSKIFLRKNAPFMDIPVAVVTDCDVREYEENGNDYQKKDNIDSERENKIIEIKSKSSQNVKYFVAPRWTLEYCLNLSDTLKQEFQKIVKSIHTRSGWDSDFEKELAGKLIRQTLNKTRIAYELANYLDGLENISLEESDTICYLKKAIEYAAGN